MNDETIVYLLVNQQGEVVDCKLERETARLVEKGNPSLKVVRAVATPAPRDEGGA